MQENKNISRVAQKLRHMRLTAHMSRSELAEFLGMNGSSYQHYEDRYKKQYLPMEMRAGLIKAFNDKGIQQKEIDALFNALDVEFANIPNSNIPVLGFSDGQDKWQPVSAHGDVKIQNANFGDPDMFAVKSGTFLKHIGVPPNKICLCSPNEMLKSDYVVYVQLKDKTASMLMYRGRQGDNDIFEGWLDDGMPFTEQIKTSFIEKIVPMTFVMWNS